MKLLLSVMAAIVLAVLPGYAAEDKAASATVTPSSGTVAKALELQPPAGLARHLRALQLVQDRMVEGSATAVDAQRALLEQMMTTLENPKVAAPLSEKDLSENLPMVLLNGGNPERIRAVLQQSGQGDKNPFLLGALAYAEGRVAEAVSAFDTVDATLLPPLPRAQFYLTNGVLLSQTDTEKAISLFAKAQLGAPGTLIEEAALRREALLVLERPERFLPLVRSYLHRFSNSPFASAFISQFAFSIGSLDEAVQSKITAELDDLLAKAQSQDRQNFYAILARSSLIGGNLALTDYATNRALDQVKNPSQLLSVRLYRAAFDIAGLKHQEAAVELQSLTRAPLLESDREILTAAISVAKELRRWPYDDADSGAPVIAKQQSTRVPDGAEVDDSAGMMLAQKLLDETKSISQTAKGSSP